MTSTLSFQPEAERYYAEGYWRSGDLWADFAARADAQPGQGRADPRRPAGHLRRAAPRGHRAVRTPRRRLGAAGRRGRPARPPLDRGRGRDARLPAPRRRARAAAADVQRHAARRRSRGQTGARAIVGFGGEKEIAKCEHAAPIVEHLITLRPATIDELIAEDATDERARARRRRHRDGHALLRHDLGAEGHRALEQHPALRDRGHLQALAARRRRRLPRRRPSSGSWAASCSGTSPCCSTAAPAC